MSSAVVIGAGLSGLATAWGLKEAGMQVTLLESRQQAGGVIRTEHVEGYTLDLGPSEMLVKHQDVEEALKRLGLGSKILSENEESTKRYIVRRGRPVAVPASPVQGIFSPLFSIGGKARLLGEVFVPRSRAEDESIADFVRRRVGKDFLNYAVGPLVSGIFAGDPEQLSMRHAFPKIWDLERRHGGLMRGAVAGMRERRRSGEKRFKRKMISFRDGMQTLTDCFAERLNDSLRLGVQVLRVGAGPRWTVRWRRADGTETETDADYLVLAVPAYAMSSFGLPQALAEALAPLEEIKYAPVSTVYLGYDRKKVSHPLDGFGMLTPQKEKRRILGTLFLSTLFKGRAPEGKISLLSFVGGMTDPARAALETDEILMLVRQELAQLIGAGGEPELARHHYWPRAIPQYNVGHQRMLDVINRAENDYPNLAIVGNFRNGPGAGDCILTAQAAVQRFCAR